MTCDVSVCIRTLKANLLSHDCLQSIGASTHTVNFQAIVVVSQSQDGTFETPRDERVGMHYQ